MFTNTTVGILLGLGLGAWVYSKLIRSTGGNTKNAIIGAVIVGGIGFLAVVTLMSFLPKP